MPERNLRIAARELARRYRNLELSPVYRNPAFGFDGADFFNLAARCDVACSLDELHDDIESIHEIAGRRRGKERFADRSLDIDVLMFGRDVLKTDKRELPRPDVLKYSFVLRPLADLAPDETHPVTGRTFADHWSAWPADEHALTQVAFDFGLE